MVLLVRIYPTDYRLRITRVSARNPPSPDFFSAECFLGISRQREADDSKDVTRVNSLRLRNPAPSRDRFAKVQERS